MKLVPWLSDFHSVCGATSSEQGWVGDPHESQIQFFCGLLGSCSFSLLSRKQEESTLLLERFIFLMQTALVQHPSRTLAVVVCAGSWCVAVWDGNFSSSEPGDSSSGTGAGAAQALVWAGAEELQCPHAAVALVWVGEVGPWQLNHSSLKLNSKAVACPWPAWRWLFGSC